MDWHTITYTVDTPMLLRGADKTTAEFRIPSLRGALRFWFRAFGGAAFSGDGCRVTAAVDRLFGAAADGAPSASGVHLRPQVRPEPPAPPLPRLTNLTAARRGVKYLVGPIIMDGNPSHLAPGTSGSFGVRCSDAQLGLVGVCLAALSRFGGLGARVRRGFGAVRFQGLDSLDAGLEDLLDPPEPSAGLISRFCELVGEGPGAAVAVSDEPSFSAWTAKLSERQWPSWEAALNDVGIALDDFRSPERRWGPQERRPGDDPRRWMSNEYPTIVNPGAFGNPPVGNDGPTFALGAFGLPIPFAHGSVVTLWDDDGGELRRASPLWIRPVRLGDHQWKVIYHVFRSQLWPATASLKLNGQAGGGTPLSLDAGTACAKLEAWLAEAP